MQIYISKNGQQHGPFDQSQVLEMLKNGNLSPNDLGIEKGGQQWQPLGILFKTGQTAAFGMPVGASSQPVQAGAQTARPSASAGKSKGALFGLLGCGGLLLFAIVGLMAWTFIRNHRNIDVANSTPTSPTRTPTPDLYKEDSERRTKFEPFEADFVKLPAKVQLTKTPYIKGKAAFYGMDKKFGDNEAIWVLENDFASPTTLDEKTKDFKAKTPEEVETVVLRTCKQYKKGDYLAAGRVIPGYNWNCEVTIVDRSIPAVIFRKTFQSKLKEEEKITAGKTSIEAFIPYSEIGDFLGSLPRK